jgi:hypothetical protein
MQVRVDWCLANAEQCSISVDYCRLLSISVAYPVSTIYDQTLTKYVKTRFNSFECDHLQTVFALLDF